jgi:hypothetical protein
VSGQFHVPDALPSRKEPRYPLGRRLGGPQRRGKFLTLPGLELRPLGRPARSQLPYRLNYPGSLYNVTVYPNHLVYLTMALYGRNMLNLHESMD